MPHPLENPLTSFYCPNPREEHDTLLLCFGGRAGNIGIPPWEFMAITESLPCRRVFVRDTNQAWYHFGTANMGGSITGINNSLRRIFGGPDRGLTRLVTVGNSAGGYAAILFGHLLGADKVVAFSPQTVLSAEGRRKMGETRWPQLDYIAEHTRTPQYLDLLDVLASLDLGRPPMPISIYYSDADPLDARHVDPITKMISWCCSYAVNLGDHNVVKPMRDKGLLLPLLARAVAGDPDEYSDG